MDSPNIAVGKVVETAAITPGLFLKKGTAENGVVVAGAGEQSLGISLGSSPSESIPVGEHADVVILGITKVMLAATLTAGDDVAPDAAGKAVAIGSTAGNIYFRGATLLESGVAGQLVDCQVRCDWKTIPA